MLYLNFKNEYSMHDHILKHKPGIGLLNIG